MEYIKEENPQVQCILEDSLSVELPIAGKHLKNA